MSVPGGRTAKLASALVFLLSAFPCARARAAAPTLECEAAECSESVALLVRTTAVDELRCTAFLVAPDTLMTARHCVEPTRRDGGRSLDATFAVVFAATPGHARESFAARVFRAADASPLSIQSANDWAVLRLEGTSTRAPIAFDRSGFEDGSDVAIHVVEPGDATRARLRVIRCRSVLGSIFAPQVDSAASPVVTLAGCDVRPGHSGGPVLDALGRVRAVVHARDARAFPWRVPLRYPRALAGASQRAPTSIAYATNLACVDWGRPGPTLDSCRLDAWLERATRPGDAADTYASALVERYEAAIVAAQRELDAQATSAGGALFVFRDGIRARVVARSPCDRGRAAFEARRLAIVIDGSGRPTLVERTERGVSQSLCRERIRG